jgi:hypothetical protein
MKGKGIFFTIVLAALGFVLFATDVFAVKPGFDDKEIRVAQFGPQTGPAAPGALSPEARAFFFRLSMKRGEFTAEK